MYMHDHKADQWSRREFFGGLTLAGAASLVGLHPRPATAEPPPETTRIKLHKMAGICIAPQYVAEEFLHLEGFTEVQYVEVELAELTTAIYRRLASGAVDISMAFAPPFIIQVDAGAPVVLLAGVHVGCFELFGTERVHAIRDLKGKTVAVPEHGGVHHLFLASMAQYVGLDPRKDINWVIHSPADSSQLLVGGKIDALVGFPPVPQELRAKKIGHVVVNSAVDRPWSQYFCCIVTGNREFVRQHPVATKRALRAILKATDVCAVEPERAAQRIVDKGFTLRYDYALQTMQEIPYNRWREYDPEDTVRFYALRLHEIGMIKSTPQKIIAQGTDWRFLNELKRELKG
jgi:NitT/TauT family transport system substrate-binding protein